MRVSRAERLIGHVLGGGDGRARLTWLLLRARVEPEHFGQGRARIAWRAILAAHRKPHPVDLGAVLRELDESMVDEWVVSLWLSSAPRGCDRHEAEEIARDLTGCHVTETAWNGRDNASTSFDVE